jgi:hypothetical protein
MAVLRFSNGHRIDLPSLGRIRGVAGLAEKTVTMQTRYALREHYRKVEVSCDATFDGQEWHGICWIGPERLTYSVSAS